MQYLYYAIAVWCGVVAGYFMRGLLERAHDEEEP